MSEHLFKCGHPKTPENARTSSSGKGPICRACARIRQAQWTKAKEAVALTPEDIGYRQMVMAGTKALGAAIDKMLGRSS